MGLLPFGRESLSIGTDIGGYDECFSKGFSIIFYISALGVQFILHIFSFGDKE
jgi:hypothetical protein